MSTDECVRSVAWPSHRLPTTLLSIIYRWVRRHNWRDCRRKTTMFQLKKHWKMIIYAPSKTESKQICLNHTTDRFPFWNLQMRKCIQKIPLHFLLSEIIYVVESRNLNNINHDHSLAHGCSLFDDCPCQMRKCVIFASETFRDKKNWMKNSAEIRPSEWETHTNHSISIEFVVVRQQTASNINIFLS